MPKEFIWFWDWSQCRGNKEGQATFSVHEQGLDVWCRGLWRFIFFEWEILPAWCVEFLGWGKCLQVVRVECPSWLELPLTRLMWERLNIPGNVLTAEPPWAIWSISVCCPRRSWIENKCSVHTGYTGTVPPYGTHWLLMWTHRFVKYLPLPLPLQFWQEASAQVQGLDLVLGHKSGHQVPVCTRCLGAIHSGFVLTSPNSKLKFQNGFWQGER